MVVFKDIPYVNCFAVAGQGDGDSTVVPPGSPPPTPGRVGNPFGIGGGQGDDSTVGTTGTISTKKEGVFKDLIADPVKNGEEQGLFLLGLQGHQIWDAVPELHSLPKTNFLERFRKFKIKNKAKWNEAAQSAEFFERFEQFKEELEAKTAARVSDEFESAAPSSTVDDRTTPLKALSKQKSEPYLMMTPSLLKQKSAPNLMMTPSASTGLVSPSTAAKLQLVDKQIQLAQLNKQTEEAKKQAEEAKERQQVNTILEGLDQTNNQFLDNVVKSNNDNLEKVVKSNNDNLNKKLVESQKIREAITTNSRLAGGSGSNNAPAPPFTSIQFEQDEVSEFTEDHCFDSDGASNTTGSFHTAPESIAASAKFEDATFLSAKKKEDCTVKSDESPTPSKTVDGIVESKKSPTHSKKVDGIIKSKKSPTPSKTVDGTVESNKSPIPPKTIDGIVESNKSPSPVGKRELFKSVRFPNNENKNNNGSSPSPKTASVVGTSVKSALKSSKFATPAKAKKGPNVATSIKKTAATPTTKKAPVVAPHTCPGRTEQPSRRYPKRTTQTPKKFTFE
mmetsp:Transcript_23979/g.56660  ORF Transcript_23979/g.56660 Transcript_23979/m.56660 type:complete len:561 (+) Transcript_23979:302-1984(+)|eukprot:CAMPEP_0113458400 /NCGR_PEP_ID=MMETSP0014_2-20120614/9904_1 /TAXON_ID=2857 /ORGANISM="Nitzschia sp." /LENGTH=560 /DNA_ID=CAMNT_0000349925 /DNA_START=733 /DNA_END=2415 /DNA_ORIENTATION=- /assembly_acc=CAM_ASM_000159